MKKSEINATVKAAFEKFALEPPRPSNIGYDKKEGTICLNVPATVNSVPVRLFNSLARAWKVKPENVLVGNDAPTFVVFLLK